ncbi:hypothetical protein AQULUS_06820 [Aquicella lusitana]|uniref:F-box domain-containing protein n=2 Tax=Aquicella lusitana TaxID=254246 RepID=A0A370GN60_9COXI|nr:hypothetical protein C8D86_10810 [Aquicella lusitana]VVC72956.1 hypothetical protein AQULUS_06820 [Aquicella lusitana]
MESHNSGNSKQVLEDISQILNAIIETINVYIQNQKNDLIKNEHKRNRIKSIVDAVLQFSDQKIMSSAILGRENLKLKKPVLFPAISAEDLKTDASRVQTKIYGLPDKFQQMLTIIKSELSNIKIGVFGKDKGLQAIKDQIQGRQVEDLLAELKKIVNSKRTADQLIKKEAQQKNIQTPFYSLPQDLRLFILSFIDDPRKLASVSSMFAEDVKHAGLWKKKLQDTFHLSPKAIDALKSGDESYMAMYDRLKDFKSCMIVSMASHSYQPVEALNFAKKQNFGFQIFSSQSDLNSALMRMGVKGAIYIVGFDLSKEEIGELLAKKDYKEVAAHIKIIFPEERTQLSFPEARMMLVTFENDAFMEAGELLRKSAKH